MRKKVGFRTPIGERRFVTLEEPHTREFRDLVGAMLDETAAEVVWDLGANDGTFSRVPGFDAPGVRWGTTDWVDFDNDGDQDIFITGSTGAGVAISG